jgi:Domain of unknown function (DUF4260)
MTATQAAIAVWHPHESLPAIGAATGAVRVLLRLEGLALFAVAIAIYVSYGGTAWMFAVLCLAPDLTFLAYIAGPRFGALIYNAAHSSIGPILLGSSAYVLGHQGILVAAVIWAAHIGFDRMLGYGLKYATGFADTHLGTIGRQRMVP